MRVVTNSHTVHALATHLPRQRLFMQADMFMLDWDFQWWGGSCMATVRQYNLEFDRDVPIHGALVPFADVDPTI